MSEIAGYRERVIAARQRLREMPVAGRGELGPPDKETGERWDRANALGHVAEMLPFWCGQVRAVLAGAAEFGRGEGGYARRREGIESWAERDEIELRAEIDAGIEDLLRLLDELEPADVERPALYVAQSGDRQVDLRYPLNELLIGHLEAHLRQLEQLGAGRSSGSPPPAGSG